MQCRRICKSTSATPRTCSLSRLYIIRAFHMAAPEVFYNREDLWQFPREPTTPDAIKAGGRRQDGAYYIMMRLPGEQHTEFFLTLPMAPSQGET